MQWNRAANAGFSSAPAEKLYLPIEADPGDHLVSEQGVDPASLLNAVRQLTRLGHSHPPLANNSAYSVIYARPRQYPFAYLREGGGERVLVVVNPANRPVEVDLSAGALMETSPASTTLWGFDGGLARTADGWKICLPSVSVGIYQI